MSSSDRKPYETATVLDQTFLDNAQDNLTNQLEMIAEVSLDATSPFDTDKLYLSDRNKYVGEHYYDARVKFPTIRRTIGELLSPSIEFSSVRLEIGNADGKYNSIMPGGAFFDSMINRQVVIKMGLRDVEATYQTIFDGFVTEVGGFGRTVKSFFIIARDKFDASKAKYPNTAFTTGVYADLSSSNEGKIIPYIYGDFTAAPLSDDSEASVPAFVTNGANAGVLAGTTKVDLVISENANTVFDTAKVVLKRGDSFFDFDVADVVDVTGNKNFFRLRQIGTAPAGTTLVDGALYTFKEADKFFVKVKGKDLGAGGIYDDNPVWQARDILITFGNLVSGDFDASWATFRDKATPAVSAISLIPSRIHTQTQQESLKQALSLLEQVRLEAFIDRSQKIKISSLHWDEFNASPTFVARNWDVQRGTFSPKVDVINNLNRLKGFFNRLPDVGDNNNETSFFRNQASIDQVGKITEKGVVFPNLYIRSDVDNQVIELLKITSGFFEVIDVTQTWRSMLLDIGDFISVDVQIGATLFDDVPCMIRNIGYSAEGLKIILKLWSFQLLPFPGHAPGLTGIVAGDTATITEE